MINLFATVTRTRTFRFIDIFKRYVSNTLLDENGSFKSYCLHGNTSVCREKKEREKNKRLVQRYATKSWYTSCLTLSISI